jgi:hypothetical protein
MNGDGFRDTRSVTHLLRELRDAAGGVIFRVEAVSDLIAARDPRALERLERLAEFGGGFGRTANALREALAREIDQ